uniref:Uncharacterized protein n=1 Tax=Anguilla anguilla TaxID=7936 RepID=A0A0E9U410_ANGAN
MEDDKKYILNHNYVPLTSGKGEYCIFSSFIFYTF